MGFDWEKIRKIKQEAQRPTSEPYWGAYRPPTTRSPVVSDRAWGGGQSVRDWEARYAQLKQDIESLRGPSQVDARDIDERTKQAFRQSVGTRTAAPGRAPAEVRRGVNVLQGALNRLSGDEDNDALIRSLEARQASVGVADQDLAASVRRLFPGFRDVTVSDARLVRFAPNGQPVYNMQIEAVDQDGRVLTYRMDRLLDTVDDRYRSEVQRLGDDNLQRRQGSERLEDEDAYERLARDEDVARIFARHFGPTADLFRVDGPHVPPPSPELDTIRDLKAELNVSDEEANKIFAGVLGVLNKPRIGGSVLDVIYSHPAYQFFMAPDVETPEAAPDSAPFPFIGGGGGYGGGFREPEFQASDPGLVEDWVRSLMVALIGVSDDARVSELVKLYLDDEYKQWDGDAVDPRQSVREAIRKFAEYKAIHRRRPEGINEEDWIKQQMAGLQRAGLSTQQLTERAVQQAQVGVSAARAGEAARLAGMSASGRPDIGFVNAMARINQAMFRRVT